MEIRLKICSIRSIFRDTGGYTIKYKISTNYELFRTRHIASNGHSSSLSGYEAFINVSGQGPFEGQPGRGSGLS